MLVRRNCKEIFLPQARRQLNTKAHSLDIEKIAHDYLFTPAGIAAGVVIAFRRVSVCLSVCPRSKRKMAGAMNIKLGTRILYSS